MVSLMPPPPSQKQVVFCSLLLTFGLYLAFEAPAQRSGSLLQWNPQPHDQFNTAEEHRSSEGRRRRQTAFPYDKFWEVPRFVKQCVSPACQRKSAPSFFCQGWSSGCASPQDAANRPLCEVKGRWYLVQGGDSRPSQVLSGFISGTPRLCYVTDMPRVEQSTSEQTDRLLTQLVSICFHPSFSFIKCLKYLYLVKLNYFLTWEFWII